MRSLSAQENIYVEKMVGIYTGNRAYHFDGIDVLPLNNFLKRLYEAEIFKIDKSPSLLYCVFVRRHRRCRPMQSVITSKFQTTIPKAVRDRLKLSVHDTLEWKVDKGKIVVLPVQKDFLKYRNRIKTGPGKIEDDIQLARQHRIKKYR
jgi:AbrB family looped-hinge helix DNA binding protein